MVENKRICLDVHLNPRPVIKFKGKKKYISTGDSDDMENGALIDFLTRPSRANVQPKKNDIIFAKMSNTDKTFLIDEELSKYIYSTGFFDITSNKIHTKYLYYLIKSDQFDSLKNANSEGTTQVSLSDRRFRRIRLKYETDISKQIKIARFLDEEVKKIDDMISIYRNEIQTLEDYRLSLINETIISNIPKGHEKKPYYDFSFDPNVMFDLKYLVEMNGRIGWQGLKSDEFKDSGPYLITGTDFSNGCINWKTCVHITMKRYHEANKIQVRNGDLLLTKDGTVGKVAMVNDMPDITSLNSGVLMLRKKDKRLNIRYLYYVLKSNIFWDWFKFEQKEAATIVHLYQGQLENFSIPLLDAKIQENVVNVLDNKNKLIDELILLKKEKIQKVISYKNSLIYESVSGEKEVA